ncbi:MAG TPA: phosphoenolpyruvate--protein phosphotransferase [Kiritimatiellia bacterium]|nr:phosphoenolpyruvate--protein phosphotransferase [Kiritimatiellia bacterium]HNR93028.1 phosphoenolpyruvate--protein phosphotransferase [Kiritimatiellia bacterium]HQQ03899.1 phosphoenolpyruvate--protein phosphotransferase [Kiritimatiellia bacterium]
MPDPAAHEELVLKGIGVSPGVAVGEAYLIAPEVLRLVEHDIREQDIPGEIARFEQALIATRQQIHEIQKQVNKALGERKASIFDAHLMVVDDHSFVEKVVAGLSEQKKNVEAVVYRVTEEFADVLSRVQDDYLRERAADVRDVARRILRNLSGHKLSDLAGLQESCIIVASDLAPSDTATLNRDKTIGFATDLGSHTSHTAIMARALEIPAVVGLHDASTRVPAGAVVLVDGTRGLLIVNPTAQRLTYYGKLAQEQRHIRSELAALQGESAETLDGYRVILSANIELPSDSDAVIRHGAAGVGLFRTEFLYLSGDHLPTEDEQVEAYSSVATRTAPHPVIIRTLDLGGDKFVSHINTPLEVNPFMGWRAIRFCLAQQDIFKTQLRAVLRASRHENIRLMYPMISNVDEVLQANEVLEKAKQELRAEGKPFNENIEVGIMIEIPSAALAADILAPHVDFFSLGTNDLVQYTLAVDRVNERVAYLYEPAHPAIIRLIKHTIDTGREHGIWTGVCGEMAANLLIVPLLIGLGADELSVSPVMVPMVKRIIRCLKYSQALELGEAALQSRSASEILAQCRKLVEQIAPELLDFVV